MPIIHPTAIVDSKAELAEGVEIGAYCIVSGPVHIRAGTVVHGHTHVQGQTTIGEKCTIGPAAYVGLPPQHLKADPDIGRLHIGDRVIIRETASLHRSIQGGDEHATRVGDDCFIMGGVHVGHDCVLANGVIAANAVLLGGHCAVGEKAFLGGGCTLHQFVRVGRLAMLGGNEPITRDAPPFCALRDGYLKGYNAIGCKRSGMSGPTIHAIRGAFSLMKGAYDRAALLLEMEREFGSFTEVRELIEFIRSTKRGIPASSPRRTRSAGDDE